MLACMYAYCMYVSMFMYHVIYVGLVNCEGSWDAWLESSSSIQLREGFQKASRAEILFHDFSFTFGSVANSAVMSTLTIHCTFE